MNFTPRQGFVLWALSLTVLLLALVGAQVARSEDCGPYVRPTALVGTDAAVHFYERKLWRLIRENASMKCQLDAASELEAERVLRDMRHHKRGG